MALVRPSLLIDFTNASGFLDPALGTLNRAGSPGVFTNPAGVLKTAPADAARFTYDSATGQSFGLMLEPFRTNSLLYSEAFDNAAWTKTGCTVTANAVAAPDGNTTADLLSATAASGSASQAFTITAGLQIAVSIFAKRAATPFLFMELGDGTNTARVWFNLDSGQVASTTAGGGSCVYLASGIKARPSGWYRCKAQFTTSTSTNFTVKFGPAEYAGVLPASGNTVYAWGAQAEAHSVGVPSSYIATTSAAVSRNGEVFAPALGSWFNAAEGTIIAEATVAGIVQSTGSATVLAVDDGTNNNRLGLFRLADGTVRGQILNGGAVSAQLTSSSVLWSTADVPHRLGMAYKANDVAVAADGAVIGTTGSATIPALTTLRPGILTGGSTPLLGSIGRILYIPRRIANADLAALTA